MQRSFMEIDKPKGELVPLEYAFLKSQRANAPIVVKSYESGVMFSGKLLKSDNNSAFYLMITPHRTFGPISANDEIFFAKDII